MSDSILGSRVLKDFPNLKLIVGHGGGYMPYQIGRQRAPRFNAMRGNPDLESFDQSLKRLYFDTVLYNTESLELAIQHAQMPSTWECFALEPPKQKPDLASKRMRAFATRCLSNKSLLSVWLKSLQPRISRRSSGELNSTASRAAINGSLPVHARKTGP